MAGLTGWFARRTHFKAALGDSVAQASRDFAAAVHLLRDALTLRAPLEAVAPAEPMRADVLLAMALAECSLARRELESGRIPHGCERLSSALDLLESGRGLAPDLLDEIDRSLELLAPACALAHLGLPLWRPCAVCAAALPA